MAAALRELGDHPHGVALTALRDMGRMGVWWWLSIGRSVSWGRVVSAPRRSDRRPAPFDLQLATHRLEVHRIVGVQSTARYSPVAVVL